MKTVKIAALGLRKGDKVLYHGEVEEVISNEGWLDGDGQNVEEIEITFKPKGNSIYAMVSSVLLFSPYATLEKIVE